MLQQESRGFALYTFSSFSERNLIVLPVHSLSFIPLFKKQLASEANMGTLNLRGRASLIGCFSFPVALR